MTAPSREDLDAAIDRFAERLVRNSFGGGAIAVALSADAISLSALLAYRNNLDMDAREAKWAAEEAQSKIGGGK